MSWEMTLYVLGTGHSLTRFRLKECSNQSTTVYTVFRRCGQACLWFWGHLGTHQQMPQSQLLCTTSAFIPTVDLKGQDLSLTAIIFKHLNWKVVRGLILLNLHMLPLDKVNTTLKMLRATLKWASGSMKDRLNFCKYNEGAGPTKRHHLTPITLATTSY